jgi:hypothetical protein
MKNLAIKMMLGNNSYDYSEVFVPLEENFDAEFLGESEEPQKMFEMLKEKWEALKWGYYGDVELLEIVDISDKVKDPSKTVKDDEFDDLWIYEELAIDPEFYSRPFDKNPSDLKFVSWYAVDCYKGSVYSKDFAYYDCEGCNRTVCGQNPSNGWHSQIHIHDGWVECNKCYEERVLNEGINEDFDGSNIPGQFFDNSDIEENGWELVEESVLAGSGRSGYKDPNSVIGKIQTLIDGGNKVLVNYESMAIGGLGGYVSIYKK